MEINCEMAHMLKWADKDFRSTIIAMFKKLKENMLLMNRKMSVEKEWKINKWKILFLKKKNLNDLIADWRWL